MEQANEKNIWIGLVEVRALPGSDLLKNVSGAFVNVLTWASNSSEFRDKATELMNHLDLELVAIENPEPLSERGKKTDLEAEIKEIAAEVRKNPNAIRYMDFHTWTKVSA